MKLEELEAKATPGPWKVCAANGGACSCGQVWSSDDACITQSEASDVQRSDEQIAIDAQLIAEVRNALPALIAVVRAARGCGNRPCVLHVGPYIGQHTNGGCHCRDHIADALTALDKVES